MVKNSTLNVEVTSTHLLEKKNRVSRFISFASHAFIPMEFTIYACFIGLLSRKDIEFLNQLHREGTARAGK